MNLTIQKQETKKQCYRCKDGKEMDEMDLVDGEWICRECEEEIE